MNPRTEGSKRRPEPSGDGVSSPPVALEVAAPGADRDGTAGTSRRRFLGGAGLAAAGLAVGATGGYALGANQASAAPVPVSGEAARAAGQVPFYGAHQAGITTAQQERLMFASLDVTATDPRDVAKLLGRWAAMASRFTAGLPVSDATTAAEQAPLDTGEAMDSGPYSLSITVGFGASLFDDRFGLADRSGRPRWLRSGRFPATR